MFDGGFIEDLDNDDIDMDDFLKITKSRKKDIPKKKKSPYPEAISNIDDLEKKLIYIFGKTNNVRAAKWLTTNGKFLDFSRSVYGSLEVMDADFIKQANITPEEYMKMGGIKIEQGKREMRDGYYFKCTYVYITRKPNMLQYKALRTINKYLPYSNVVVKCMDDDMNVIWECVYSSDRFFRVIEDVNLWFDKGINPRIWTP